MVTSMSKIFFSSKFFWLWFLLQTTSSEEIGSDCTTPMDDACSIFLAPSSIPHAGLGVYTTRNIPSFCSIFSRPDGPSIVLTDYLHEDFHEHLFSTYVWEEFDANGMMESLHSSFSVPNLGSLINHNSYKPNVGHSDEASYDDSLSDRFKDPGAGAYSYYYQMEFVANFDIEAGEELFVHYGDSWMDGHGITDAMGSVDYKFANDLFKIIAPTIECVIEGSDECEDIAITIKNALLSKYSMEKLNITKEFELEKLEDIQLLVTAEIYEGIKEIVSAFNKVNEKYCSETSETCVEKDTSKISAANARLNAIMRLTQMISSPLAKVFPMTIDAWSSLLQLYQKYDDYARSLQFHNSPKRSIGWIKENGFCLENVEGKISTMPQAGRGAFATRFLSKGSMVIPAPLTHIIDRTTFLTTKHDIVFDENDEIDELIPESDTFSYQLMLNYCFSHKDTTLLLCPSTSARLINHCGRKMIGVGTCDERGPNTEIRWSTSWDEPTSEWLKMSLSEIKDMTEKGIRGLAFDIVATRDILPGEEIFIDYGNDWEDAWEEHVSNWQPPNKGSDFESFMPISEMNKNDFIPRTKEELEKNPYAKNVVTLCDFYEDDPEGDSDSEEGEYYYPYEFTEMEDIESWSLEELIDEFLDDGSDFHYEDLKTLRRCQVIDKDEESNTFLVRILGPSTKATSKEFAYDAARHIPIFLEKYPRDGIVFVTETYMSDQHLPNAFRHHIGLRDDMVPDQWRNIRYNRTKE